MNEDALSEARLRELVRANIRAIRILRAGRVATFTAWSVGVFGLLSLLLGILSPAGLAVGAALLVVAWRERRGRAMLRSLEPRGPRVLGSNQLLLLVVIAAWCLWAVWRVRTHPTAAELELVARLDLPDSFVADLATATYLGILGVAVVVQLLLARYHYRRGSMLESHLDETPDWAVELQRERWGEG